MKYRLILLVFVSIFLSGLSTNAQNADRFPKLHQRIFQAKLREISQSLKLDEATLEKFRPVYLKYERAISEIDFVKLGRLMKVNTDSLSAAEADQLIVYQFECTKRLTRVRENFYQEFKKILTSQQIVKLYQTEAELRKKVTNELNRRQNRK